MDQLHGVLASKSLDKIAFVTAATGSAPETPMAAAIAIQQPAAGSRPSSDMATMIHAGLLPAAVGEQQIAGAKGEEIISTLSSAIDNALYRRGVRFFQWPTDASDGLEDSIAHWCRGFGFQSVGTLDYLGGPAKLEPDSPIQRANDPGLRFEPIDWSREGELSRYAELVEQTYEQTLDCPDLCAYRTAAQTLNGYRASSAFHPEHWFTVRDTTSTPIGCLVLAIHRSQSPAGVERASVVEIVYMGLVPNSRGSGLGKILVQRAFQAAEQIGADRMILAVDCQNKPARTLYELAGLQRVLRETVWVKSLSREE